MANDATNVRVGATGKVYGGTGTDPTDATTAPAVGFTDYGYVSEDGVSENTSQSSTTIKAWGGDEVRKMITEDALEYEFTLLESKDAVIQAWSGDTDGTAAEYELKLFSGIRQEWIIDVIDGEEVIRIFIPDGQVSERGSRQFATEQAVGYPIKIACYPDGSGVKAYVFQGTEA